VCFAALIRNGRQGDKVAKLNLKERAKRSVIAKTTTSKMGKRAIKSKAPPQMTELINALKTLVQRETGSSRKANDMENNVLRVGVKMYFLVVDGKLEPRQVLALGSTDAQHARHSRHARHAHQRTRHILLRTY
jgi:sarcosine oxidase gamma subunit